MIKQLNTLTVNTPPIPTYRSTAMFSSRSVSTPLLRQNRKDTDQTVSTSTKRKLDEDDMDVGQNIEESQSKQKISQENDDEDEFLSCEEGSFEDKELDVDEPNLTVSTEKFTNSENGKNPKDNPTEFSSKSSESESEETHKPQPKSDSESDPEPEDEQNSKSVVEESDIESNIESDSWVVLNYFKIK